MLCETMKFSRGAGPDMVIHKQIHTWTRYTPVFYWSQTDLSSVYKELVRFSFALSAASMYRQNVQTLPSLPLMARAWYKTVTSPSFDWKGLFTSPYQDSIYSIFVLNLFCKFKHERVLKKNAHKAHAGTCTPRQKNKIKLLIQDESRLFASRKNKVDILLLLRLPKSRIYRRTSMWLYLL